MRREGERWSARVDLSVDLHWWGLGVSLHIYLSRTCYAVVASLSLGPVLLDGEAWWYRELREVLGGRG